MEIKIKMDIDNLVDTVENLEKTAKEIESTKLEIGIINGDEDIQIKAAANEYGATIHVTNKMRAWFAHQGFPLKKSTTVIEIPERSYLRKGQKENLPAIKSKMQDLLPDVIKASIPISAFMEAIGDEYAGKIQETAKGVSSPPNSPMTVAKKGSSNPLVDSGELISKIESKVIR